jgi:hypothetical protein
MPTILRTEGYRVYFYSHEPNEPAHVHVDRGGASAKIWLDPVGLAGNSGFSPRELANVLRLVRARQEDCLEAWRGFFNND